MKKEILLAVLLFALYSRAFSQCEVPTGLGESALHSGGIELYWSPTSQEDIDQYFLEVFDADGNIVHQNSIPNTRAGGYHDTLSAATRALACSWHIESCCSGGCGPFSDCDPIGEVGCACVSTGPHCTVPSGLTVTNVTATTATVNWADADADFYNAGFKVEGRNTAWKAIMVNGSKNILSTTATITGLKPNTAYKWRVASSCSGVLTPVDGVKGPVFTTKSTRIGDDDGLLEGSINVTPNPSSGKISVMYKSICAGTELLRVLDITGKTIYARSGLMQQGLNTLDLDLTLPQGIYVVEMKGGGFSGIAKFVLLH